jgi:uncharacterized repeat protein (TIGR03943 family)
LLLKYWLTDQINLLLHPDYRWLAIGAGIILLLLAVIRVGQGVIVIAKQKAQRSRGTTASTSAQHITLLPKGMGSLLLIGVAVVGLGFTPRPFSSDIAFQRGISDTLIMTRSQPQAFRGTSNPEDRSIVEWIRTLNVYPEPDAYTDQRVNVDGFVIHPPELAENYFMISRFIITCCAADVYPVGLPVKLAEGDRTTYGADQWFQVQGHIITETLNDLRQVVIQADQITPIPEPENPYDY